MNTQEKWMKEAIKQAEEKGFLGENIMGTGFSCKMRIKAGAGAFVCGEETALIESLQGERGMPRLKPPFPAQSGYWYKPSNINNVETFVALSLAVSSACLSAIFLASEIASSSIDLKDL